MEAGEYEPESYYFTKHGSSFVRADSESTGAGDTAFPKTYFKPAELETLLDAVSTSATFCHI